MKIAILSDIHGNVFALKSVLNAVKKKDVSRLMIAGDFIGYYFWPAEVFNLLKDWDLVAIRGNHDQMLKRAKIDKSYLFDFEINKKEKKDLIEKASICINGISLTISSVTKKGFQIWIIPHTFKLTNLSKIKKGDFVNVEIDILSKYVKNFLHEKK